MKKIVVASFVSVTLFASCECSPNVSAAYSHIRPKIEQYYSLLKQAIKSMQDETDKLIEQQVRENVAIDQAFKNYLSAYLKTFEDAKTQSDIKNIEGLGINYKGVELKKEEDRTDMILSRSKLQNSQKIDKSIKREIYDKLSELR